MATVCAFSAFALTVTGCFKISINPTCPATASVGDTGNLVANEKDAGHIPTYLWNATPATAVTIADPTKPDTTFKAVTNGEVTFHLAASDGLFQADGTCKTQISTSSVVVALVANPLTADLGVQNPSTMLTCTSTGATPAISFVISQANGPTTQQLRIVSPGISVAVFDKAGDAVFRCIGTDAGGNQSPPAEVTVTVTRSGTKPPVRP